MLISQPNNSSLPFERSSSVSSVASEDNHKFEHSAETDCLTVIKPLSESNFPVFLVSSSHMKKYCVMKVFPYENNAISPFYLREARLFHFSHPNIVSMPHIEDKDFLFHEDEPTTVSYILTEYACYGDFLSAATVYRIPFHDKLLRTYFHQLIEGLEYLHSKGIAHLDIKPENLLMDEDYTLKITDFDLSYMKSDGNVQTRGTKNYRAPEIFNQCCQDPEAADVYSAGIVLFMLKCGGVLPYYEEPPMKGPDLAVMKEDHPEMFWETHCRHGDKLPSFFNEDFRSLFLGMTKFNPEERATISQVKSSKWYNGDIYSRDELREFMKGRFDIIDS